VASERDSGRENAVRSMSSDQGRRSERDRWTESEKRERKKRRPGVVAGSAVEVVCEAGVGVEIGNKGGFVVAIILVREMRGEERKLFDSGSGKRRRGWMVGWGGVLCYATQQRSVFD
jgi:hypothetical protein